MTMIRRPNPFGELMSLRQAMDRLFEDSFVRPYRSGGTPDDNTLALDVYATSDSLVVEAALPGIKPEDLDITVLGETLTISANTATDQSRDEGGYTYREIRRGSFSRTVTLPSGLKTDAATASFENGLLRLSFPKADEAKPRQIQIRPATEGQATQVLEGQQPAPAVDSNQAAQSDGWTDQSAGQAGQSEGSTGQSEGSTGQSAGGQANEWQASDDWSATNPVTEQGQTDQGQSEQPHSEWQSTSEWQSGEQWQSDGQSNGQPRVEQAS